MHLNIPHTFSKAEATQRVKQMLQEARTKISDKATIDEERWEGDTLHFAATAEGQQVSGQVEVTDSAFVIDAKLPFMLRLFEGQIEKKIQEQAKQLLG
ncbi:MAG TPA: polyhydroxyalkanoic acid system family protein [Candidatus Paceibacterota bacterium]|nr:polyhydroxyalkanoic acid system family protein [Candidatus Paceibacterota bacterium]